VSRVVLCECDRFVWACVCGWFWVGVGNGACVWMRSRIPALGVVCCVLCVVCCVFKCACVRAMCLHVQPPTAPPPPFSRPSSRQYVLAAGDREGATAVEGCDEGDGDDVPTLKLMATTWRQEERGGEEGVCGDSGK
jgi:hypothetical protein